MTANDNKPSAKLISEGKNEQRPCPICGKPRSKRYDPFCSKRCADVDLHRWLKGSYVIPGASAPREREDENE